MLEIRQTKTRGRGVFATTAIPPNTTVVECPVVSYDIAERGRIEKTRLGHYQFAWGQEQKRACIILGVISVCNHAEEPNAEVVADEEHETMALRTRRPIAAGEELLIRYRRPLWFQPA